MLVLGPFLSIRLLLALIACLVRLSLLASRGGFPSAIVRWRIFLLVARHAEFERLLIDYKFA